MNSKTKKIIAREGLVILATIFFGLAIAYLGDYLNRRSPEMVIVSASDISPPPPEGYEEIPDVPPGTPTLHEMVNRALPGQVNFEDLGGIRIGNKFYIKLENLGLFIFLYFYPLYWLIRFIIWAIRTLRRSGDI